MHERRCDAKWGRGWRAWHEAHGRHRDLGLRMISSRRRRSPSTSLQLNFRGGRLGRLGGTGGGGGSSGKGGNGAGSISWTLGGGGGDDKRRTNGGGGGPIGGGGGEIWSVARTGTCVARTEASI
eukprot:scaffold27211_cov63-Phaeocystis_antarctica.AAC.10